MTVAIRASRRARRYDRERGCYVYDIAFKTAAPLTERAVEVAEAFGLGLDEEQMHVLYRDFELRLAEGDVVYITGDSGSGKSVLLRALKEDLGPEAADMDEAGPPDPEAPIVDTVGATFQEALRLLSMVGLGDAFLFLRRYGELSEGQRYRYRVARLIDLGRRFWLGDEFCSTLDRCTARMVAYNVQRMVRRCGATLVVATAHADLMDDLDPSIVIRKGWGREIGVEYRCGAAAEGCTVCRDVRVRVSGVEEYRRLSYLHYRAHEAPVPMGFYAVDVGGELAGVIAYSYAPLRVKGRREAVGYVPDVGEVNRDWAAVSRVVVHPKYRGVGLGARLVRDSLPLVGRRHVELTAVMAQYNPFAERAGMRRVLLAEPDVGVLGAVEALRGLGFNPAMLGSRAYSEVVLAGLGAVGRGALFDALCGLGGRYVRRLSRRKGFMGAGEFREWLGGQGAGSLAWTLQILGTLAQAKVYLYWCRDWGVCT